MAKLTWLGPDDYEAGETPPSSCTWNGITFPVGVAVEVDHPTMIAKAKGNRMFKVEDAGTVSTTPAVPYGPMPQWREPDTEADPADVSFFDDPPEVETPLDLPASAREDGRLARPDDYPPEEEPKRKPGRPRKVTPNADSL